MASPARRGSPSSSTATRKAEEEPGSAQRPIPGISAEILDDEGQPFTVLVDYAHTPDAVENACRTLKELNPARLITVFGCGGVGLSAIQGARIAGARMIIAVDGPTASGKGTVAAAVAQRLGYRFLDSGAMYRAAALKGSEHTNIRFEHGRRAPDVSLANEDVEVAELAQRLLVAQREVHCLDWSLEDRQQAVGLVRRDFGEDQRPGPAGH